MSELQEVGVQLGLRLHEVDSIRTNHRDDINQAACEVLRMWRENNRRLDSREMKQKLKEVFMKVGIPVDAGLF